MRKSMKNVITTILNNRFSFLFFTIIMLFLLRPFIEGATAVKFVTNVFLWFILISCVWAVSEKRKHPKVFLGMVVVASVAILADILAFLLQSTALSWTSVATMPLRWEERNSIAGLRIRLGQRAPS